MYKATFVLPFVYITDRPAGDGTKAAAAAPVNDKFAKDIL